MGGTGRLTSLGQYKAVDCGLALEPVDGPGQAIGLLLRHRQAGAQGGVQVVDQLAYPQQLGLQGLVVCLGAEQSGGAGQLVGQQLKVTAQVAAAVAEKGVGLVETAV